MLVRKKPEKAVPVLLDRLSKIKDRAMKVLDIDLADENHNPELNSKFDGIESKLKRMTDSLSKISNWEKKVADQLCALEQVLDDEIFTFKAPEMESQLDDELSTLTLTLDDGKLISTVDQNPNPNHNHELSSKLDDFESELKQTTETHSKIKNWKEKVVNQFHAWEQVLDDGIFAFKVPEMESQLVLDDEILTSKDPEMESQVMNLNPNPNPTHELSPNSKFDGIESKLKKMADSLSKIKNWEKKVGDQLFNLERKLDYHRIIRFQDGDDKEHLTRIQRDVIILKNSISVHNHPDNNPSREFISKFPCIESEMKQMTDSLSKIQNWEKKVVDQLCVLEQGLDDEIFTFKNPYMRSEVDHKLTLIQEDVVKLKSLISTVDHELSSKLDGGIESKLKQMADSQSQKWAQLGVEDNISESNPAVSALLSTFHCLNNSQLKMCLLSLSVFPENTHIKKRPLIYWWIGEGFVAKTAKSTAEEAGEQVLQELLNEGFIKSTITNKSFLLYPWTSRMLIMLAQRNNFIRFSSDGSTPCNGNRRAFLRRVGAMNDDQIVRDPLIVFNVDEQYLGSRSDWLPRLHRVEVLQMGRWQDSVTHHIEVEDYEELFKGLGSQKHLKYLSLRGISRIETLPRSIKKLVSLQILDLRACHNLEKLPPTISELRNLTHLDVSECYLVESMPKGLERLSKLQVLKGFLAGSPSRNSCKISDLARRLLHLRKLSLRVRDLGNEQLGSLVNFSEALHILTISWGVVSSEIPAMDLPTSLTKLDLRYVPFEAVPEWLQPEKLPVKLEKLYVKGGKLKLHNINQDDYNSVVKFNRFDHLI
ncbi:hypothetical protein C2S52_009809 [Perilla frutescens var. hirtella]|nr:hypothetical protein C2S52_009809 [Perilla frutescens var. hirtella]